MARVTGAIGSNGPWVSPNKKTSIGRGNIKFSSMNKSKKSSFKKYRGQGK